MPDPLTPMYKETYDAANKSLNVYNSANHTYLAPGTNPTPQSVADRLSKEVWVTDYGAQPSVEPNVIDCRAAIEKAVLAGGLVRFPPGVFYVSKSAAVGIKLISNTFLVGAGQGATVIKAMSGAGNIHLVATVGSGNQNIGIRDLTLDHNGQNIGATDGCHAVRINEVDGFYMRGVTVKNSDQHGIVTTVTTIPTTPGRVLERLNKNIFISDIYLENIGVSGRKGGDGLRLFYGMKNVVVNNVIGYGIEYHGIHVAYGAAAVSNVILYNVGNVAISPESEGVVMSNIHVEWESDHLICDILANRPASGTATTFGRHFYASDWNSDPDHPKPKWYYDNGFGWNVADSNPTGLWAITREANDPDPAFPPGGKSHYSNIKIVMNITANTTFDWPNSHGFRFDTDYNNANNIYVYGKFLIGAYISANNNNISNITIDGCREDGIRISGDNNILDGWRVVTANNGPVTSASNRAVRILNSSYNKVTNGFALDAVHTSVAISEEQSGGGTVDNSIITGNYVVAQGATKISTIGPNSIVRGNLGYKTEARGTATIVSGNTSVVVEHGLNRSPINGSIMLTPTNKSTNNPGRYWVSAPGGTTFTINCESNPGASGASFSWNAEIL